MGAAFISIRPEAAETTGPVRLRPIAIGMSGIVRAAIATALAIIIFTTIVGPHLDCEHRSNDG